jgi:transcriptional regulator with XRE-family HTH domain
MITGAQIRAGRKLLGWDAASLSKKARIAPSTLLRAEASEGEAPITIVHENAIRTALTAAGVEFVPENDGETSVRLRKQE